MRGASLEQLWSGWLENQGLLIGYSLLVVGAHSLLSSASSCQVEGQGPGYRGGAADNSFLLLRNH
jgi:hypothetical protein